MSFLNPIDTTRYTYEEWIRFAFDHPVSNPNWYHTEEGEFKCAPSLVLSYYTRLFREPCKLLSSYDEARLEQGFWFIAFTQLNDWLWNDDISLDLRLDCIEAMPILFKDFFQDHPLEVACNMWWDILRNFKGNIDPRIVEAMVNALEKILQLPVRHCQMSALHGLGHLQHKSKEAIIRTFLVHRSNEDAELRDYAEKAIAGKVL